MGKKKKGSRVRETGLPEMPKNKISVELFLLLIVNTVVVFALYRALIDGPYYKYLLFAYMTVFAVLTITFVVYNRGFSRRGITKEMLPDSMTEEEKEDFIQDGRERLKKSRWMITVIFPFVFAFAFEAFSWLFEDIVKAISGK